MPPAEIYTLSLHDALPISLTALQKTPVLDIVFDQDALARYGLSLRDANGLIATAMAGTEVGSFYSGDRRSEEHTSELQSRRDLVCRLLLEKKKHTEWK